MLCCWIDGRGSLRRSLTSAIDLVTDEGMTNFNLQVKVLRIERGVGFPLDLYCDVDTVRNDITASHGAGARVDSKTQ